MNSVHMEGGMQGGDKGDPLTDVRNSIGFPADGQSPPETYENLNGPPTTLGIGQGQCKTVGQDGWWSGDGVTAVTVDANAVCPVRDDELGDTAGYYETKSEWEDGGGKADTRVMWRKRLALRMRPDAGPRVLALSVVDDQGGRNASFMLEASYDATDSDADFLPDGKFLVTPGYSPWVLAFGMDGVEKESDMTTDDKNQKKYTPCPYSDIVGGTGNNPCKDWTQRGCRQPAFQRPQRRRRRKSGQSEQQPPELLSQCLETDSATGALKNPWTSPAPPTESYWSTPQTDATLWWDPPIIRREPHTYTTNIDACAGEKRDSPSCRPSGAWVTNAEKKGYRTTLWRITLNDFSLPAGKSLISILDAPLEALKKTPPCTVKELETRVDDFGAMSGLVQTLLTMAAGSTDDAVRGQILRMASIQVVALQTALSYLAKRPTLTQDPDTDGTLEQLTHRPCATKGEFDCCVLVD